MRHATISAWQRQEDGSYAAELHGWTLRVVWHPEPTKPGEARRGFSWVAEQGEKKLESDEIFEEMELAMAQAEERTEPAPEAQQAQAPKLDAH